MGGLAYIRNYYKVPAFRGRRIKHKDAYGTTWTGKITSSNGPYLRVLVDDRIGGYRGRKILHPTWQIEYM